jgi:hypothetical protein
MKRIDFYPVLLLMFFSSCSYKLDLVDPISPIPVVYFQLNPDDSICFLTLTKTFSGDGSAYDLACDANHVFYDSAEIHLEGWSDQFKVWEDQFRLSDRIKIPGIFPETPGYCFELPYEGLIGSITSFRLVLYVPGMLTPAFSRIPLISLRALPAKFDREIALYPNGYKLESIGGQGVEYRQVLCEFHYQQYEETWVDHSVTFLLKKNLIIGGDNSVYPDLFFNLLLKNIEPLNDTVIRKFRSIDLIYLGADQFYKDYVETYINTGNMDLPPNGNITNGLGLFTMIRSAKRENMVLDQQSFDSLWNGEKTRKLGFVRW